MSTERFKLPEDSILHLCLDGQVITETPESFTLATAMSAVGAPLKRGCWVDQVDWKVYPNLSVLLVGPSGIGKDTAIASTRKLLQVFYPDLVCAGKTMEMVQEDLLGKGDPAAGVIYAPELTAFLGGKDYQKSMVQELTDLLSTGEYVDVSTKSHFKDTGSKRVIPRPTVTMVAGSTLKWLHEAMPKGSLEGGFIPRLLVVVEEKARRHVPWIKYSNTIAEVREAQKCKIDFAQRFQIMIQKYSRMGDITPLPDAIDYYTWWYENRFSFFPASVKDYANRSRDQMLRLAMLSAITRDHNYIEVADLEFAATFMGAIAKKINDVALPQNTENQCANSIINMLPAKNVQIFKQLSPIYKRGIIEEAMRLLNDSGKIAYEKFTQMWVPTTEATESER